jgi:Fe2+ transport system protein FeoA
MHVKVNSNPSLRVHAPLQVETDLDRLLLGHNDLSDIDIVFKPP